MFTGIVQGTGIVTAVDHKQGALVLEVDFGELVRGLSRGASVALGGVCLTAIAVDDGRMRFDVIGETLEKTTLGLLRVGEAINVERSAKIGDEIGGHLVSGHVSGTVELRALETPTNNHILTLGCDGALMPYLLPKGFVALDGCSLTIVDVGPDWFTVHLIPETLARTSFAHKKSGDRINLEIDAMTRATVDTVKRYLRT